MSKSYLSLLFFAVMLLLLVPSCKRDAPDRGRAIIEVDFLTNNRDLERYGLDYTAQDLERDSDDPNRVLTVAVGEPVKFKDTSKGSTNSSKRTWKLNDNEWEQAEDKEDTHVPEFTHVFDAPGLYRISLYVEDVSYATKLIKVVSEEFASDSPNIAEVDETAMIEQEPQVEETPRSNVSTPTVQKQTPKTTPTKTTQPASKPAPPPPPAKITNIDFSIKGDMMAGNSVELRDLSSPSSAIFVRQWDFGDGTTQKTKGGAYNQIYWSPGEYTITMCLNNSNQCTSKKITIKAKPVRKETVVVPPPPKKEEVKKPEIAKVEFKVTETAVAGTAVNLTDRSQPSEAVLKRKWSFGDGTPDLNTGKSAISHVFNKAGTYEIELCLNDKKDKCSTQKIIITAVPVPVEVVEEAKPTTTTTSSNPSWLDNYDGTTPGRVGLLSSQKCDETSVEWHEGAAFININPKQAMELDVAKVYANSNGTIDIILTTGDKKETAVLNNIQVNPGPSNIYLTDLAIILEPGQKYTLMIKPSNPDSGLKLENAVSCKPRPLTSEIVSINYNEKFILYDLKFFH
jgi:PKD repeat protein